VLLTESQLTDAALSLASIAGVVANVCDHAEHNEPTPIRDVRGSAERLRALAVKIARAAGREPLVLYAERLGAIERRNVLHRESRFDGNAAVREARSWRDLQLAQIEHDRFYHLDVAGLTKADQLRHYALHLAKLAGAAADVLASRTGYEDFVTRRVADMLLFGIKLSTVTGERLGDDAVVSSSDGAAELDSLTVTSPTGNSVGESRRGSRARLSGASASLRSAPQQGGATSRRLDG
jgi:hypothetical protein